jgi:hypothetical protein
LSLSLATHAGSTSHPLFQDPESIPDRARDRRRAIRLAWEKLLHWSRSWRSKAKTDVLERTNKVYKMGVSLVFREPRDLFLALDNAKEIQAINRLLSISNEMERIVFRMKERVQLQGFVINLK